MNTTQSKGKLVIQGAALAVVLWYLFGGLANAACPLTGPVVTNFSADHYYTRGQWSALPMVQVQGPHSFDAPVNGDPSNTLWYLSVHEDGSQNPVLLEPELDGTQVEWTFSQVQLSNGCYQAEFSGQGIKDAPFDPAFCVYGNPILPASCDERVSAGFKAEVPEWQVVDSIGAVSPMAVGRCITQTKATNPGEINGTRGVVCSGPTTP